MVASELPASFCPPDLVGGNRIMAPSYTPPSTRRYCKTGERTSLHEPLNTLPGWLAAGFAPCVRLYIDQPVVGCFILYW
jgi:hypothetical protein